MKLHPDRPLRCLLINPEFRGMSFWDFTASAELLGAKTAAPPLGLITVAAILPQHWEFRLLDLNTRKFSEKDWQWADIVCSGGMLPQQANLREIIDRAVAEDKYVVVGGADPSSQPHLYEKAHTLVVGEGEEVIPTWLDRWRAGQPFGVFKEKAKPDVATSPTPRFDLLDLSAYVLINLQYSRGCPYNCEFCDIIELYGRKPRTKAPEQMTRELDELHRRGFAGEVFIVDDNFIGNKANVTRHLLPALIEWNRKNDYPFYYTTEASLNLMDDDKLMSTMQEAEFRNIFFGIETPDPDVLRKTQKKQNSFRPILDRIRKLYAHGMVAYGGFIMGLDGEKDHMDEVMIRLIDDACINVAMVGFLVAMPNTQLFRRLLREGRLLSFRLEPIGSETQMRGVADANDSVIPIVDQTIAGLNFRTQKDRIRIMQEFLRVIESIYEPRSYFDRVHRLIGMLKGKTRHRKNWFEIRRDFKAFARMAKAMTLDKDTRRLFWRNVWAAFKKGPAVMEPVMHLMAMYVHFKVQAKYTVDMVRQQIPVAQDAERRLTALDRDFAPQLAHG